MWIEDRDTKMEFYQTHKIIKNPPSLVQFEAGPFWGSQTLGVSSKATLWLPNLQRSPAAFGGFASHQGHTVLLQLRYWWELVGTGGNWCPM